MSSLRSSASRGHNWSALASSHSEKIILSKCPTSTNSEKMQSWPSDALKAMETHLTLLRKEARRNREFKQSKEGREDQNGLGRDVQVTEAMVEDSTSEIENIQVEDGPLVELNSQSPLPRGWEQFLDLRTGQVYFIDWNVCKRSRFDPRKFVEMANDKVILLETQARACWELQSQITELGNADCLSESRISVARRVDTEEMELESKNRGIITYDGMINPREQRGAVLVLNRDDMVSGEEEESVAMEGRSSSSSSSSSWNCEGSKGGVVVKGCKQCLSYFMQSKVNPLCPSCGGEALI